MNAGPPLDPPLPKKRVSRQPSEATECATAALLGHNGGPPLDPPLPLDALTSLTIDDAVRRTGFSRSRLYVLIDDGRLHTFRFGRRRFVDAQSLRQLLAELMEEATPRERGAMPRSLQRRQGRFAAAKAAKAGRRAIGS